MVILSTFKNKAILDYPVNEVFDIFKETAKRDFPKFNEKNPIGVYVDRKVGTYSVKEGKMRVEITDYKEKEIYEITSKQGKSEYKSRYEFSTVNENKTKLLLTENNYSEGALHIINAIIAAMFFRGRVKKRFRFLVQELEKQIEINHNNL